MQDGLRQLQESYVPLHEETQIFRVYTTDVMPGFFQTPGYATALFTVITEFDGVTEDIDGAVEARMDRSRILHRGTHQFVMVLEEAVLRYRIGDNATMTGQLKHLLAVMSLPNVSLGVIPLTSPRLIWPMEAFHLFDDRLVEVELAAAELSIENPAEIATYVKAFGRLQDLAVHGDEARALITSAIEALD